MLDRRETLRLLSAAALMPASALAAPLEVSETRADLAKPFADSGVTGVFAAFDPETKRTFTNDASRAAERFSPASTFKVPNALIAIETGAVSDADREVFKWDGVKHRFEQWNKDHTLRSAIVVSAVPVYQEVARRIGRDRMQKFLDAFDYGNRAIGPAVDHFWLDGSLRISALEQLAFFDQLRRGGLPVSARSQEIVRSIVPMVEIDGAKIHAKTGLTGFEIGQGNVGWFAGWVERGGEETVFALNLDINAEHHPNLRLPLARQCLKVLGAV